MDFLGVSNSYTSTTLQCGCRTLLGYGGATSLLRSGPSVIVVGLFGVGIRWTTFGLCRLQAALSASGSGPSRPLRRGAGKRLRPAIVWIKSMQFSQTVLIVRNLVLIVWIASKSIWSPIKDRILPRKGNVPAARSPQSALYGVRAAPGFRAGQNNAHLRCGHEL